VIKLPRPIIQLFSVTLNENGWFWCSDAAWEVRGADSLIGPFASRDEAVRDAWETLGIKEEEQ
jgi:hypothetical protein